MKDEVPPPPGVIYNDNQNLSVRGNPSSLGDSSGSKQEKHVTHNAHINQDITDFESKIMDSDTTSPQQEQSQVQSHNPTIVDGFTIHNYNWNEIMKLGNKVSA